MIQEKNEDATPVGSNQKLNVLREKFAKEKGWFVPELHDRFISKELKTIR